MLHLASRKQPDRWIPIGFAGAFGRIDNSPLTQRGAPRVDDGAREENGLVTAEIVGQSSRVHHQQQAPPMTTDILGNMVQVLDDEVKDILERRNLTDRDKVIMYKQVLQWYNAMVSRRVKELVRMVAMNEGTPGGCDRGGGGGRYQRGSRRQRAQTSNDP